MEGNPDGWTLATLEKYFSMRLAKMDLAITKAEGAMNERLAGMNEFRSALADQAKQLMPRTEYQTKHDSMVEKIDALAIRVVAIEESVKGRASGMGTIGSLTVGSLVGLSVLISVASFIFSLLRH